MAKIKRGSKKGKKNPRNVSISNISNIIKTHSIVKHRKVENKKEERKRLNAIARLELIKKGFIDNRQKNVLKSRKGFLDGISKTFIERDRHICKERKIRRAEIMAKTRGRGLRVRHTNWSLDSFIQCRS